MPAPTGVSGPSELRQPCPDCGSVARTIELRISAAVETDVATSIEVVKSPAARAAQRELLSTHARELRWTEPGGPGGPSLLQVFDAEGNFIDAGMGDDLEDALLAVAERLLPSEGSA